MKQLSYSDSKKLLIRSGFKIEGKLAINEEEAKAITVQEGFPIAMKIASPDIVHKTDADCVAVNIQKLSDIDINFHNILAKARKYAPKSELEGIVIQKMVSGTEIIIGAKYDPVFGPVVMFGLGGIFVEALKDVSFRIAPFDKKEALKMIEEIKGIKILKGLRGKKPANIDSLAVLLVKVSSFMLKNPEIKELDFNPIFVDDKKSYIVDIRLMVEDD